MKQKFDENEGTFYETVFCPSHIEVLVRERRKDEKRSWEQARAGDLVLRLIDKNGQKLEVRGTRLVSRALMYLRPLTDFQSLREMKELKPTALESALNEAIKKKPKEIKLLYNGDRKLVGIASTLHKQISWKQVREIIERCVEEICGKVEMPETHGHFDSLHASRWNYRLPVENENVSAYVGIHAGNNIIRGRSGIHVWSKFRTERDGGVKRPACLNWCGMWEVPLQWFGVNTQRLNNIFKVLGKENVAALRMAQFHIHPDMEKFEAEVKNQLRHMVRAVEKMQPVIDESIHSKLTKTEMQAILTAYREKVKLPKYVIKQILEHVEEETVWGFSQAVSWVRTHGNFKDFRICKPIEDRQLTQNLENIAGEVLSLTPTINDFHSKVGEITLEKLLPDINVKAVQTA